MTELELILDRVALTHCNRSHLLAAEPDRTLVTVGVTAYYGRDPNGSSQPRPIMSSRLHPAAWLAFGILLAASLACGDDSTSPGTIEGLYTLRTIGGKPLPSVIAEDSVEKTELTSGSITLGANSVFTLALAFRRTNGIQAIESSGTSPGKWTRSGSTVTMRSDEGGVVTGAVSGAAISVNMPGAQGTVVWVFRK